jgi:hypothetical protein
MVVVVWDPHFSKNDNIASQSNLKQIDLALLMYSQDYEERLPPMTDLFTVRRSLESYLGNSINHSTDSLWQTPELNLPYAINESLSWQKIGYFAHPDKIVTFWDTRLWDHKCHIVAFLDGHVRNVPELEWYRLRIESGIAEDAPIPKEPSAWVRQGPLSLVNITVALLLLAFATAFAAAWRDAIFWTQGHDAFLPSLFWRLFFRFMGHGLLVAFAAITVSLVLILLIILMAFQFSGTL